MRPSLTAQRSGLAAQLNWKIEFDDCQSLRLSKSAPKSRVWVETLARNNPVGLSFSNMLGKLLLPGFTSAITGCTSTPRGLALQPSIENDPICNAKFLPIAVAIFPPRNPSTASSGASRAGDPPDL
jgi:hypothetical protein